MRSGQSLSQAPLHRARFITLIATPAKLGKGETIRGTTSHNVFVYKALSGHSGYPEVYQPTP